MKDIDLYGDMELEELYDSRKAVEKRIDGFFGRDDTFYAGDQGYQDLLEDLGEIQDHINNLIGYEE